MTDALTRQRCWTHGGREAVSRCPQCRRYYCRECVTEHNGKMLCMQCLAAETAAETTRAGTRWLLWAAAALVGLGAAFLHFYSTGYVLQQLPPAWAQEVESE